MKYILAIAILMLIGCSTIQPVCRHRVMMHYAVAQEVNVPARIVVYKVDALFSEAHAQVQIQRDGQWIYMQDLWGLLIESGEPEFKQVGYVLHYTVEDWLTTLRNGHYHY